MILSRGGDMNFFFTSTDPDYCALATGLRPGATASCPPLSHAPAEILLSMQVFSTSPQERAWLSIIHKLNLIWHEKGKGTTGWFQIALLGVTWARGAWGRGLDSSQVPPRGGERFEHPPGGYLGLEDTWGILGMNFRRSQDSSQGGAEPGVWGRSPQRGYRGQAPSEGGLRGAQPPSSWAILRFWCKKIWSKKRNEMTQTLSSLPLLSVLSLSLCFVLAPHEL